jgi:hypothetical protein
MITPYVLIPLNSISELQAAGISYPKTVDGWRWLYRCRHERGLDGAFVKTGRRILVDIPRYLELIRGARS